MNCTCRPRKQQCKATGEQGNQRNFGKAAHSLVVHGALKASTARIKRTISDTKCTRKAATGSPAALRSPRLQACSPKIRPTPIESIQGRVPNQSPGQV